MTTKNIPLFEGDNSGCFFTDQNPKYNNLNLNQNQKTQTLKLFSSKSFDKKLKNDDNNQDYSISKKDSTSCNSTSKKSSEFLNFSEEKEIQEQNTKNPNSNKNSSTLSLHIAAYEKSNKSTSFDGETNVNGSDLNKALKNVKQLFAASSFEIQNPFEFLRQQQEEWSKDPEIMQFKSSQKLINNYQPNPIQKFLTRGKMDSGTETMSESSIDPSHPYKKIVLDAIKNIVNLYSDSSLEGFVRLKQATECIDRFFAEVPKNRIRIATLLFMDIIKKQLEQIKDMDPIEITHRICIRYESCLKQKYSNDEEIKEALNYAVPDKLWNACFEHAINFRAVKYGTAIEKLFHILEPENPVRAKTIEDGVKWLLDDEKSFHNGVAWIDVFKLNKLKDEQFDTIIYKAHIIAALNVFDTFLATEEDQIKYLRILDNSLIRCYNHQNSGNDFEHEFLQTVTRQKLPNLIGKQAKKYGVDIEKLGFRAHRARVISDIRYKFNTESRDSFEHLVVEAFRNRDMEYKIDFVESFNWRDRNYAYCWAKYFNIPQSKMPKKFLNSTDASLEAEAEAFVNSMTERSVTPVAEDCSETVTLFGKTYELITVGTGKALKEFAQKYFIDTKPKVLGLDAEAGSLATGTDSKVTVLQLATPDWLCLIDVYMLSKELVDEDWTNFFTHIFHPDITRIGFAFLSDYAFIFNAFPHLLTLLQEESRKVLCLQKLLHKILTDIKAEKAVFPEKVPNNISLADICETVLGYSLSKEMQNSNWTQRPLSQEQKIYAVSDALVVVLIKDKIEEALKSKLDESEVDQIINEGYINQVAKIKSSVKKEKPDFDSAIKVTKKQIDFCDVVDEAKKVAENLQSEGVETFHPKDIRLILDAPFFNLFSFLHNLGIDAYDVRLKGVAKTKEQISIINEEMLKDDKTILVTTEKRKKDFPSVASNEIPYSRILLMPTSGDFVSVNYISRILQSLKVCVDEDYFFSRCEKCSSKNIQPMPSPIYVLAYYIYLIIKKIGFRFSVTMEDIQKASTDVKNMIPSEYGDFTVNVFLRENGKYLPDIIIDTKHYRIKPFTFQIIPKGGDPVIFKPSGSAFFASKRGVNHIVCLDCGNMYHKEDSKEIRDLIAAGKASYNLSSVCDTDVEEVRMKIVGIIRNVFCEKKATEEKVENAGAP